MSIIAKYLAYWNMYKYYALFTINCIQLIISLLFAFTDFRQVEAKTFFA